MALKDKDHWEWEQPTDRDDLINRLAHARDTNVPARERENLCGCAYTELRQLGRELAEKDVTILRLETVSDGWQLRAQGADALNKKLKEESSHD